jgi:hypothetical protein
MKGELHISAREATACIYLPDDRWVFRHASLFPGRNAFCMGSNCLLENLIDRFCNFSIFWYFKTAWYQEILESFGGISIVIDHVIAAIYANFTIILICLTVLESIIFISNNRVISYPFGADFIDSSIFGRLILIHELGYYGTAKKRSACAEVFLWFRAKDLRV